MSLINFEEIEKKEEILKKNIGKEIIIYQGVRKIKGKLREIDEFHNLHLELANGYLKVIPIRKVNDFEVSVW
jgi:small nuclear ribonucleoprotein (snRNP)-like protein